MFGDVGRYSQSQDGEYLEPQVIPSPNGPPPPKKKLEKCFIVITVSSMSRLSLCGVLALAPAPTLAPTCASAVAPEPSYSQMSSKAGMRSGKCFVVRGYIYIYVYIHPYSRERLRGPRGGGGSHTSREWDPRVWPGSLRLHVPI